MRKGCKASELTHLLVRGRYALYFVGRVLALRSPPEVSLAWYGFPRPILKKLFLHFEVSEQLRIDVGT